MNANAIILNRADTPFLDELFGIGLHALLQIGYTSSGNRGTTTKAHIGRISCDKSKYCLWVTSNVNSQMSAIIDQIDYQGENPVSGSGIPNNKGSVIELDGNASLQIGQIYAEIIGVSVFQMPNKNVCSEIHVSSLKVNWSASPPNAYLAYMPKCGSSSYDLLTLSNYAGTNNSIGNAVKLVQGVGHLMMPSFLEKNSNAQ